MLSDAWRASTASPPGRNTTADRAIEVLLLFDERHPVLAATEIAARLGMSRSTTYRYLQSLRAVGLVEEDAAGGRFRLGPRILSLARVARQALGLPEVALPVMRDLAAQTGETVLLTRRSQQQVVCVERVEANQYPIRISYERGHVLPLHAGASAKVLLAFEDPVEIEAVLASGPLPRYTERTVTDPAELRRQLGAIREAGYVVTDGEVDAGVRGVAAPVWGADGRVVAGLSIAGPAFRLDDGALPAAVAAVQTAAATLSQRLRDQET